MINLAFKSVSGRGHNTYRRILNTNYGIINCRRYKSENAAVLSHQYSVNLVRQHDYENYVSLLLIKEAKETQCAFALRAFNVEISRIVGSVSQEAIAKMRFRFWHDALDKIYDKQSTKPLPDHPVIYGLNRAIQVSNLPKLYFQRLLQAKERPTNTMFQRTSDLEHYVEQSTSTVYYLLLKILGIENINADHAASHLGKAQGICNMLRALSIPDFEIRAFNALPVIPQEILLKYGCSFERVLRQGVEDDNVTNCIFDVASIANDHLVKARNLSNEIPAQAKTILLPAIAVDRFLVRLRRRCFYMADGHFLERDGLLPLHYYWNNRKGNY